MPDAPRPHRPAAPGIAILLALALTAAPSSVSARSGGNEDDRDSRRVVQSAVAGRWVVLALRNGRIVVFDLVGGRRHEWESPAEPVRSLAVDPGGISALPRPPAGSATAAGEAPVVIVGVEGPDAGETTLHVVRGDDGRRLTEMRIPGEPGMMAIAPGEGRAYVVTSSPVRRRDEPGSAAGRWSLRSLDLSTMRVDATLTYDGTVHDVRLTPDGQRLYVALDGFVRSFATHPLRSSWMLRSPGRNLLVHPIGPAGAIVAVRDAQLALLNPDNLPGAGHPGEAAAEDDAIVVVELPYIGRYLDVDQETSEAIVLDARGTRLATVDLERGKVTEVEQVPEVAAAAYHPGRDSLVLFQIYAERVFEMLHEPPDRDDATGVPVAAAGAPAGGPDGSAPPSPAPGGPATGAPASQAPSRASGSGSGSGQADEAGGEPPPEPLEEKNLPATRGDSGAPPASAAQSPDGEGSTPGMPPLAPPAPEPGERSGLVPGVLSGRLTGQIDQVEAVVFYGPDSVLKEHVRVSPDADGTFSLTSLPKGRYRVVVVGAAGVQLRCSPPLRIIQVGAAGVPGLDFEVAGKVKGRLEP